MELRTGYRTFTEHWTTTGHPSLAGQIKITGQMSIITGQVNLKKLIHQANSRRAQICSILLFLDLLDRKSDLDQGVCPLVVDLGELTDIVLPGEEEELIIAHTLLPPQASTDSKHY